MNDEQLLRYSRHLLLDEIDLAGQEKLLRSHVLVIGVGGLGSAAAPYLAAAGIGTITLMDFDAVELGGPDDFMLQQAVAFIDGKEVQRSASKLE